MSGGKCLWSFALVFALCGFSCMPAAHIITLDSNVKFASGEPARAVKGYLKVRSEGIQEDTTSYNLGTCYLALGESGAASGLLGQGTMSADPALASDAHYNLGMLSMEAKDWKTACASFRKALTLKPGTVDAKANLEICIERMKNENRAKASGMASVSVAGSAAKGNDVFNLLKNSENARYAPSKGNLKEGDAVDDY